MYYRILLITLVAVCCLTSCSKKTTETNYGVLPVPTFSIESGTYSTPQSVYINCVTPGAEIRYTVNGANPTTESSLFSVPIVIDSTMTIKAIAYRKDWSQSPITTASYTFQVATPVFSIEPGYYFTSQTVTLSCETPGAVIRYSFNAVVPDTSSAIYSAPIQISSSTKINARAYKAGCTPSSIISANYNIFVMTPDKERHITSMSASPDTIYADNGISFSTLSATVKDGNNLGVPDQHVTFKTTLGRIIANVTTNNQGIAQTTFWDEGATGIASIKAIAKYYHEDYPDFLISADSSNVMVTIAAVPPVSSIALEMPTTQNPYQMTVMQPVTIRARVKNIMGGDAADNTLVTFSSTIGYFINSKGIHKGNSIVVPTINGRATVSFNAGTTPGSGVFTAAVANITSSRNIVVSVGKPAIMVLRSFIEIDGQLVEADTISVNSPNIIWMQADIKDKYNNVVPSQAIKFRTTLGTFINATSEITTNTDFNGMARVRYTPGLNAGTVIITASANSDSLKTKLLFNIKSTELRSIRFVDAGQIDLNVINTGGIESAIVKVKLYDFNGNLITVPKNVSFKIMNANPPNGVNLNGQPVMEEVVILSNNGEAQVTLYSGTQSGIVIIRARCFENGNYITASKSDYIIHCGPPNRVEPFASGNNTGINIGGGLWKIVAGAYVYDIYNNPVDYGTSVWFYLPDDDMHCMIGANAYTGNESAIGDSTAGVAYTTVTYSGYYSFENLKIRAVTGGVSGMQILGEIYIVLPINQPQLELEIVPGSLIYHGINNSTVVPLSATALLNVSLFDSQGCPIHNVRISMTSTHGVFEYTQGTNADPENCNLQITPNIVVTDWYDQSAFYDYYYDPLLQIPGGPDFSNGQDGLAQGKIRFFAWEIPFGDIMSNTPGITTATVTAQILGITSSGSVNINLIRYPT